MVHEIKLYMAHYFVPIQILRVSQLSGPSGGPLGIYKRTAKKLLTFVGLQKKYGHNYYSFIHI